MTKWALKGTVNGRKCTNCHDVHAGATGETLGDMISDDV